MGAVGVPELLAPAADRTCLVAAVENGADAVYFGLQRHNARIRAHNFDGLDLPEVMALLHRRGVKGYVTLNTLVFPRELPDLEASVRVGEVHAHLGDSDVTNEGVFPGTVRWTNPSGGRGRIYLHTTAGEIHVRLTR